MTFAELASKVALPGITALQRDTALGAMGAMAKKAVSSDEFGPTSRLASQFVRNLKDVGVEAGTLIERALMASAGLSPESVAQDFHVSNALDVIAARTHLRSACILVGFSWAPCMLVQSGCAELCRFLARYPGAALHVGASRGAVELTAKAAGLNELELQKGRPDLTCLFENARRFTARPRVGGDDLCFTFEAQASYAGAVA